MRVPFTTVWGDPSRASDLFAAPVRVEPRPKVENVPLFREILADPHDDDVRLVYSDWLEEAGDSARAEFIRLQLDWHNALPRDRRRPGWWSRIRELRLAHGDSWRPPPLPGIAWGDFQRGFVASLTPISWEAFAAQASEIFRLTPLVELDLCFNLNTVEGLSDLTQSLWLEPLSSLNLNYNRVGNSGAQDLAFSPHLTQLRSLSLNGNLIGDPGAIDLSASPQLHSLTELRLYDNLIRDAGALSLLDSPRLTSLHFLDLRANPLSRSCKDLLLHHFPGRVLV